MSSTADNENYSYDADGNRTYQVINGAATNFSVAAISNRINSVSGGYNDSYGYDADGDMTTLNGSTWWQYGPFDRLASVGGMSYENSAEGQRIRKSGTPGTTYFAPAAGGTLMAEYDPNGVWLDYIWLNGKLVTVVTSNGGVYPVHDDQTDRPVAMTNLGNQSVIWAAQNLPFTTNVTATTWFNFNIRFPGQYYGSEDEVSYNGNRDYSEVLGRYIESDPIGLAGGINTYAYVGNNPISNVDPLGLCKHHYKIKVFTPCSPASAFSKLEAPNMSAPGAPQAQTGFTSPITLLGNNGNNRISQYVNPSTMTIVNTALPGHQFYPGSVTMQVTPGPLGVGSVISITGQGNGSEPLFNDLVGWAYFGDVTAQAVQLQCDLGL